MESTASAEPSDASASSSNVVLEASGRRGECTAVESDYFDTVDGEPIDVSKHPYGGRGTLHAGARVLYLAA